MLFGLYRISSLQADVVCKLFRVCLLVLVCSHLLPFSQHACDVYMLVVVVKFSAKYLPKRDITGKGAKGRRRFPHKNRTINTPIGRIAGACNIGGLHNIQKKRHQHAKYTVSFIGNGMKFKLVVNSSIPWVFVVSLIETCSMLAQNVITNHHS